MANETARKESYYLVSPGIWLGKPLKYNSLDRLAREYLSGEAIRSLRADSQSKVQTPKTVAVRELLPKDTSLEGTNVKVSYEPHRLSEDKSYYLIREYVFHRGCSEYSGYEVTEHETTSELVAMSQAKIEGVEKQRSILTQGLEITLEAQ